MTTQDLFEDANVSIWKDDDGIIIVCLIDRGVLMYFTAEELSNLTNALVKARKKK